MFYYSSVSRARVVHYESCHHIKNMKAENLERMDDIREVRQSGYRLCSCCSPLTRRLRREESEIQSFCHANSLKYTLYGGHLYIRTPQCDWVILASEDGEHIELHHENSYKREHANSIHGYHKQEFCSDSIVGFLSYISDHDYYRMLNPYQAPAKKKAPPKKGTKRYKGQQKAQARKERSRQILNVLRLIDGLHTG